MKRTVATALLSACLLTLSACSGVNLPITETKPNQPTPPQVPAPYQPGLPFVFNPACAMAYPSLDLTPCVEPDGTPIPINPVETAILAFTNELRTKGTLDGKITDATGVNIYDGVCKEALYARDQPNGISKLLPEAHIHYAALKHSQYLVHNEVFTGKSNAHDEDPTKELYYHKNVATRVNKAGITYNPEPSHVSENVMAGRMSMNTRDTAYYFVLSALRSEGHCRAMMTNQVGYTGVGYVIKPNNQMAITVNFIYFR